MRRLLDVWGFVPGFAVPAFDVAFSARDGVRLAASYLPGPAATAGAAGVPAVVVLHGFAGHRRKPAYGYLAERLTEVAAVLAVDLRGHGRSGGASTLGLTETLDVAAAGAWLRRRGHRRVALVGASMGGTAAVRAAGAAPAGAYDAVCAISTPAVWGLTDTPAMRQLTRVVTVDWYRRLFGAALRIRIAPRAWPSGPPGPHDADRPAQPLDAVAGVAPTPLLIVHGVDDHYFGVEQAQLLFAAAREPKTLWLQAPGFGHAEDGFTPAFADRLVVAVAAVHHSGRWPDQARSGPLRSSSASSVSTAVASSSSRVPSSCAQNADASRWSCQRSSWVRPK